MSSSIRSGSEGLGSVNNGSGGAAGAGAGVAEPFVCDCGKSFSRVENLVRHAKTHRAVKPWPCPLPTCNKGFSRPDLLKRHKHSVHKDIFGPAPGSSAAGGEAVAEAGKETGSVGIEEGKGLRKKSARQARGKAQSKQRQQGSAEVIGGQVDGEVEEEDDDDEEEEEEDELASNENELPQLESSQPNQTHNNASANKRNTSSGSKRAREPSPSDINTYDDPTRHHKRARQTSPSAGFDGERRQTLQGYSHWNTAPGEDIYVDGIDPASILGNEGEGGYRLPTLMSGSGGHGGGEEDNMGGRYLEHQEQHTIDQLLALANAGNGRAEAQIQPQASTSNSAIGLSVPSMHQERYQFNQPHQIMASGNNDHQRHTYHLPQPTQASPMSGSAGEYRSPNAHPDTDYHTTRPYGSTSHVNWDLPPSATSPSMSGMRRASAMTPSDSGRTSVSGASRSKRMSQATTGGEEDQPDKIPITGEFVAESVSAALQNREYMSQQNMIWDALGHVTYTSPRDTLAWDSGMHWILDDSGSFLDLLGGAASTGGQTDPPVQPQTTDLNFAYQNATFQQDDLPRQVDPGSAKSDEFGVNPEMFAKLLREIRPPINMDFMQAPPAMTPGGANRGASVAATPAVGVSRGVSPVEEGQGEEDRWPTNWKPAGKAFTLGASSRLQEIEREPDLDDKARSWKHYWLDVETLAKVQNSFALAKAIPGPDVTQFKMPSLHTVNHFISLYFEHFHYQLPVLHLPTFDPKETSPLLLAGLIQVGACFSHLRGARAFAVDLIEVTRKTLNALFEHDATNLRSVALIHVYLLTMLTGLFVGNKRTYELAEASRGTLINLCRKADLLNSSGLTKLNSDRSAPLERWRLWISQESRKRLGIAICLLDTIFPALLDSPAYHSHGDMINTVLPCDEHYWNAPTHKAWNGMLGMSAIPPSPYFTIAAAALLTPIFVRPEEKLHPVQNLNPFSALTTISALHHHVFEFRTQLSIYESTGMSVPLYQRGVQEDPGLGFQGRRQWLKDAFDLWREQYYHTHPNSPIMNSARAMCHLGHISLHVYIGDLYTATGKRGKEAAETSLETLEEWAKGASAIHAVSHALELLRVLPSIDGSPYHPLCCFVAILCAWAYLRFRPPTSDTTSSSDLQPADQKIMDDIRLFLYGTTEKHKSPKALGKQMLDKGARLLAHGKAWRIASAFALVLAKVAEQETFTNV